MAPAHPVPVLAAVLAVLLAVADPALAVKVDSTLTDPGVVPDPALPVQLPVGEDPPEDPPGDGWPAQCTPSDRPPYAPYLWGKATEEGFLLEWKDHFNALLGVPVDAYLVFRSGTEEPEEQVPPYAIVPGDRREFLDPDVEGNHTYWIRGANCAGPGHSSNQATSSGSSMTCLDSDLNLDHQDPVTFVWVDARCGLGPPCKVGVRLIPPQPQTWC